MVYALIGNWLPKPASKGISLWRWEPETTGIQEAGCWFPEIQVGEQAIDEERGLVYFLNECATIDGEMASGGEVLCAKIVDGGLKLLSRVYSMGSKPAYCWLDPEKKFLLTAHHAGRNSVTKAIRTKEGKWKTEAVTDDAGLVLFRLSDDGLIGEVCDVKTHPGTGKPGLHGLSHLHSVTGDPTGSVFLICDKGRDKLYSYRIDRQKGELVFLDETDTEPGFAARYSAWHPVMPIVYANNENKAVLEAYRCDLATGSLTRIARIPMLEDWQTVDAMPSDLKVDAAGKYLYTAIRKIDKIAVFALDQDGMPGLIQVTDCGGEGPRGLCFDPSGKSLLSANIDAGTVTQIPIREDGTLGDAQIIIKSGHPGNIHFMKVEL